MYAQLGNIRFEGLKGFSSMEKAFGVNYAQHERINGKPRLEAVGDVLDTISFEMYLHAQFTDPEADIEAMRTAMKNREVLTLILGNGNVVGNFVIPNFTENPSFTDPFGNIIETTLSVELLEAYSEDPLKDAQKAAINTAFATTTRNSNVRSVLPPKQSPGMAVTDNVAQIQTSGARINQYTEAAESNTATFDYYSSKITESLDTMEGSINTVQAKLTEAQDLEDLATSLPTALAEVNTRIQNMRAVLPISDIESFKIINRQLQGSVLAAKTANVGISNQSIIRRK